MRILLDTHALIWWLTDDRRLSQRARAAIAEPAHEVCVSAASGWEVATKVRLGKLPEAATIVKELPEAIRLAGFEVLPVSLEHALAAGSLGGTHRDPFDRMLIAQARIDAVPIVTVDPVFKRFRVRIVW